MMLVVICVHNCHSCSERCTSYTASAYFSHQICLHDIAAKGLRSSLCGLWIIRSNHKYYSYSRFYFHHMLHHKQRKRTNTDGVLETIMIVKYRATSHFVSLGTDDSPGKLYRPMIGLRRSGNKSRNGVPCKTSVAHRDVTALVRAGMKTLGGSGAPESGSTCLSGDGEVEIRGFVGRSSSNSFYWHNQPRT